MMNQKSDTSLLVVTLVNFLLCLVLLLSLFKPDTKANAQGEPPPAFLGPIYYGSDTINAVFDHNLPLLSIGGNDGNNCTQHYDGTLCNEDPPFGLGYNRHDGIDYGISYEPVLAAADGVVYEAGWSNASNHRYGLGLRVRIEHSNDYITEYGHLSVLHVKTNDLVTIDATNRKGIIGISGSTGNVSGTDCTPDENPLCGAHLHFGLIDPDGIRVNPYGWIGTPGADPWELHEDGALSYDVWDDYPSIIRVSQDVPLQFPNGEAISDPGVNHARIIIDDASADFRSAYGGIEPPSPTMDMPMPDCWQQVSDSAAYNHAYRRVLVNDRGIPTCGAFWYVRPDAFTPPGDYAVFVHVPPGNDQTLGAAYTIRHNGQTHTAQPTPTPSPTPAPATHTPTPPPSSTPTPAPTATATVTGQATPLTAFPDSLVYDAVWSPDGAQVAFTADDAIWLVTPGQSPTQITQSMTARHPAWLVENN